MAENALAETSARAEMFHPGKTLPPNPPANGKDRFMKSRPLG